MRLLLQLSLTSADAGSVLERADDGRSIVPRRVLLVQRVVLRSRRRLFRPDGMRHWRVRLLCKISFADADELADYHADRRADGRADGHADRLADLQADSRADGRTDGCADERANGGADNATDRAADVNADGPSDGRLVYNCVRLAGVNVRRHIRRHLLRRSSCV